MMKKILIGLGVFITVALVSFYFTSKPTLEKDGSYSPSPLALSLATVSKTDYTPKNYKQYQGVKSKVAVLFTEQKNMKMENGRLFSTGNHPIEALLPMLHLKNAGFDFEILTATGKPVVFEMWAFPQEDAAVKELYNSYKTKFESPKSLSEFMSKDSISSDAYAAVFIPGGHGAMLGIPEDTNVDGLLRWAYQSNLFTITLCHGPGALLATESNNQKFLYEGYKMAVFPDAIDAITPMIGYLPGNMTVGLSEKLKSLGVELVNSEADNSVVIDRRLITGASPLASNALGVLAATTLLENIK